MSMIRRYAIGTAVVAAMSGYASAEVMPYNLTQDSAVRETATYVYYSRNGSTFTTRFYPGPPHGANDSYRDGSLADSDAAGGAGAPISFATGDLTNPGNVGGWRGVVDADGRFDILFDLGALYTITSVTIDYSDFSGYRWNTNADAQAVLLASSLAGASPQESDFTLFDTATFTGGSTTASLLATFEGAETVARYVLFRGAVIATGNSSNNGGVINEITITGAPVPEPGAAALTLAGVAVMASRRRSALP